MQRKVFLGIQTLGMIQKKSPAQKAGLDHSSRLNLTLSGCSSAEPTSVSVQQCKIQIINLYLQPVKIISHLPSHSVLGFFGSNHVINLISTRKSFATLISENNKSKFKDVYRILIEYKNSKALFQSRIVDVPSTVIETLRKNEQKQLRHFIDSLMCAGNLLLPAMQISPSLATNFDYLIIVKSGKPVTPIR